jgi:glutathione S-transferase
MILYGRNLSPFTRRVAIWCALQGRRIERREISVAGADFDEIKAHNPVVRVPVLVLDDGANLIETFAICDYLDETAPNGTRLVPQSGAARMECLRRVAVANSTAEKAVAMVYERNRRPEEFHWREWQARVAGQVQGGLAELDAVVPAEGWSSEGNSGEGNSGEGGPDGGDIAAILAYQFVEVTNPWLLEPGYPRLAALAERGMEIEAIAATKPVM